MVVLLGLRVFFNYLIQKLFLRELLNIEGVSNNKVYEEL